jgi:hypothetical protein
VINLINIEAVKRFCYIMSSPRSEFAVSIETARNSDRIIVRFGEAIR